MKKSIGIIAALLLGVSTGSLNIFAAAGQEEAIPKATPSNAGQEQKQTDEKEEAAGSEISQITNLQIPQRLAVVLDPWELDGKGQIYSEEYTIQNAGDTSGILTLSFVCTPGEHSGVSVAANREGIHDEEQKCLFIKIVFGNGEELCLSEEGTKYRIGLEAGEALTIRFEGELNENASGQWKAGDVSIEGIYSWDAAKKLSEDTNPQERSIALPDDEADSKEAAKSNEPKEREKGPDSLEEMNGESGIKEKKTDN